MEQFVIRSPIDRQGLSQHDELLSQNGIEDQSQNDLLIRSVKKFTKGPSDLLKDLISCELQSFLKTPQTFGENRRVHVLRHPTSLASKISANPFRSFHLHIRPDVLGDCSQCPAKERPKYEFNPLKKPIETFSTPGLEDDFYLTLLDWSSGGLLAAGVQGEVVIWRPDVGAHGSDDCREIPGEALRLRPDTVEPGGASNVAALSWSQTRSCNLAVGRKTGVVEIWDAETQTLLRCYHNHKYRVGVLDWMGHLLSSGSRDKSIIHRDVRVPGEAIFRWDKHKQEICGLSWCPPSCGDEGTLASGGNDNVVLIWQLGYDRPVVKLRDHGAAVKALSWCPYARGVLTTGGGTNDRCIRLWDVHHTGTSGSQTDHGGSPDCSGQLLSTVESGSQVCNLLWSKSTQQLLSTHGFTSNQVIVWDLQDGSQDLGPAQSQGSVPSLTKKDFFEGHSARVLYGTMNFEGDVVATGAGDGTIRLWNVFPPKETLQRRTERHPQRFSIAAHI